MLCAYLGQLARLRDALANHVAVVIDDRDQEQLVLHEDEEKNGSPPVVENVKVATRVHHQPLLFLDRDPHAPIGPSSHRR